MRNNESWQVANSYAAKLMIVLFLLLSPVIYVLDTYTIADYGLVDLLLFGLAFLAIYVLTERKLEKTFGDTAPDK